MSMKHWRKTFTVTVICCMAENSKIYCIINDIFRDGYREKLEAIFRAVGTPKKVNVMNHFVNYLTGGEEILLHKPVLMKGNAFVILTNKSTVSTGRKVLDTVINVHGDHDIPVVMKILDNEDTYAFKVHDTSSSLDISANDSESANPQSGQQTRRKISRSAPLSEIAPRSPQCSNRQYKRRVSIACGSKPRETSVGDLEKTPSARRNSLPASSMLGTKLPLCQKNVQTARHAVHNVEYVGDTNEDDLTCPLINHRGKYVTERNDCSKDSESSSDSGSGPENADMEKHRKVVLLDEIKTESKTETSSTDLNKSRLKSVALPLQNVADCWDKMTQRVLHMNERLSKLCEETSRIFVKVPEKQGAVKPSDTPRGRFPAFLHKHTKKYGLFRRANQGLNPVPQASAEHQNIEINHDNQKLECEAWNHEARQNKRESYKFHESLKMRRMKEQSYRSIDKKGNLTPNASATSDSSCNTFDDTLKAGFDNLCEIVKQMCESPGPGRRYTYTPQM